MTSGKQEGRSVLHALFGNQILISPLTRHNTTQKGGIDRLTAQDRLERTAGRFPVLDRTRRRRSAQPLRFGPARTRWNPWTRRSRSCSSDSELRLPRGLPRRSPDHRGSRPLHGRARPGRGRPPDRARRGLPAPASNGTGHQAAQGEGPGRYSRGTARPGARTGC
jgi:hypothetical protein